MSYVNMPLDAIPFSERTRNALMKKNDIKTTKELRLLRNKPDSFFFHMKGVGRHAVREIKNAISIIDQDFLKYYKENCIEEVIESVKEEDVKEEDEFTNYKNGLLYIPIKTNKNNGGYSHRDEWKKSLNDYLFKIYKSEYEFSLEDFIDVFVNQLSNTEIDVLRYRLFFLGKNNILTLGEIAKKNNITGERIRQTEKSLLDKIKEIFTNFSVTKIGQDFKSALLNEYNINDFGVLDFSKEEKSKINGNFFAYVVVCMLVNEYDYLFLNDKKDIGKIVLVYKKHIIDNVILKRTISRIDKLYLKKKPENIIFTLEDLYAKNLKYITLNKREYDFCILNYLQYVYGIVSNYGDLIFPQNKKDLKFFVKKELQLLEDPIHFNDMYKIVIKKYPNFTRNPEKVHASLVQYGKNVGKGLYVKQSHYMKGGTIGDIAESYLQKIGGKVKYSTLIDYVMYHRKTTPTTIYSMLLEQDKNKRFVRLKGGWIGLSANNFEDTVSVW